MKLFIRLFLALGFFLLNGFGNLHADTCMKNYVQAGLSLNTVQYNNAAFLEAQWQELFKLATIDNQANNDQVDKTGAEDENEDDELPELKKNVKVGNYFTSFFYSHQSGRRLTGTTKKYPFRKHFAYTSDPKLITLRVMRI